LSSIPSPAQVRGSDQDLKIGCTTLYNEKSI
jgi:hypothetical protein